MKTGFIWDERFAWFYSGFDRRPSPFYQPHPALDTRETKERIRELLVVSGLADTLISVPATPIDERDILRHHTPEYLAKVRAISEHGGGDVGEGAWVGPHCYDIVRLSAGACAAGLDSVLDGKVDNIYVLCRPAIMRRATPAAASAFSPTFRSRSCERGHLPGCNALPCSTGTCITATAPRRRSIRIPMS